MEGNLVAALTALERKIITVLDVCGGLRAENQALRERVTALEQTNETLNGKIETACARLEELMVKLPEA